MTVESCLVKLIEHIIICIRNSNNHLFILLYFPIMFIVIWCEYGDGLSQWFLWHDETREGANQIMLETIASDLVNIVCKEDDEEYTEDEIIAKIVNDGEGRNDGVGDMLKYNEGKDAKVYHDGGTALYSIHEIVQK